MASNLVSDSCAARVFDRRCEKTAGGSRPLLTFIGWSRGICRLIPHGPTQAATTVLVITFAVSIRLRFGESPHGMVLQGLCGYLGVAPAPPALLILGMPGGFRVHVSYYYQVPITNHLGRPTGLCWRALHLHYRGGERKILSCRTYTDISLYIVISIS